jgi:hypothetical protein
MRDLIEVWFYTGNVDAKGNKRTVAARSGYDLVAFKKKGWVEVIDEPKEKPKAVKVEKPKVDKPKVIKPKKEKVK